MFVFVASGWMGGIVRQFCEYGGMKMTVKKKLYGLATAGVLLLAVAAIAQETPPLTTREDKMSYSVGIDMGRKLRGQDVEINLDSFMKGMKDGLSGNKALLSEYEIRRLVVELQSTLRRRQAGARAFSTLDGKKPGGDASITEGTPARETNEVDKR